MEGTSSWTYKSWRGYKLGRSHRRSRMHPMLDKKHLKGLGMLST